jgi:hypothetical protein
VIQDFIGGFISILVGVTLVGPISNEVLKATIAGGNLSTASPWGATVLNMVPGFFSLSILGVGIAILYNIFRRAGIVG